MKRSLVVLASLMACTGAVMAQTPQLTLWGMIDVGVSHTQGKGYAVGRNASNNDRFGIRGVEELGNGWSATFALQHRFDPDTGTTEANGTRPFWQGESRIGLRSKDYGWLRLGRGLTPVQDANGAFEPYGVATVGNLQDYLTAYYSSQEDTSQKFNPYGKSPTVPGNEGRVDKGVFYDTPTIAGFTGKFFTQPGPVNGGKTNQTFGAALIYGSGPVAAMAGIERNNRGTRYFQTGASYDFGVAKLMASWARNEHPSSAVNGPLGAKITGWGLGFHVPVTTALKIRGGYGHVESDAVGALDGNKLGVGLMYSLSKRTYVYSDVARGRGLSRIAAPDVYRSAVDFGIHHDF